jgi:hypothetical protein
MEKRQTSVSRLDENVIITMLAISIVAFFIFAFKYKNYNPCVPFTIRTTAAHYQTGEVIRFETSARSFQRLQWNFGDNQNNETRIASAVHAYDQPGEYTVTIAADNNCAQYKTLVISPAPRVVNPLLLPTFVCPQMAEVGKPVTFQDTTKGASKWEWRFGETATVDATAANPTYTYSSPGLKTVSLVINNDPQQLAVCKVYVNAAPPKATPQKTKPGGTGRPPVIVINDRPLNDPINEQLNPVKEPAPAQLTGADITKPEIEAKLRQVADKLLTAESFSAYMCGNLNIPVSVNGTEVTFVAFCNQLSALKSSKKIKRLEVQMFKDNNTHCIKGLNVNFKKKEGFLGIGN